MRISDWSSDVCSSDLSPCTPCLLVNHRTAAPSFDPFPDMLWSRSPFGVSAGSSPAPVSRSGTSYASKLSSYEHSFFFAPQRRTPKGRSEEHTSELQSLMRISYAVFCLQKQKTTPSLKIK